MTDRLPPDEREALIVSGRDGALGPDEAAEVSLLADLLGDPATWATPAAGLEDSVLQAVAAADPNASAPAAAPTAPMTRLVRPARKRRLVSSAIAAAAAVVLVVVGVTTLGGGAGTDYTAQLGGTPLARAASASGAFVRNDAGFRITLHAHGLPRLPADEYYQAWLKNGRGILVPVGTFSSSDGRVTLWSGVSPKDYPTMSVTIESADNDQASSGRRVLVGPVRAH